MPKASFLVIGATGLVGSSVYAQLKARGEDVVGVNSTTYREHVGSTFGAVINCNGNTWRFRANKEPAWDLEASVRSVERSLADFKFDRYLHISTVDVYDRRDEPANNHEAAAIDSEKLDVYGRHKLMAEGLVLASAAHWNILRLGTVLGPGLKKGPVFDLLENKPLHMSLDSELTFIDTDHIVLAVDAVLAKGWDHEIVNVTGGGSVSLRELAGRVPRFELAADAGEFVRRYDVNTAKAARLLPLPSTREIAHRFIDQYRRPQA